MFFSRTSSLLLPFVVMIFSAGFVFSDVDVQEKMNQKVEKDYLHLVSALSLSENDLSTVVFEGTRVPVEQKEKRLSMQLLSLKDSAKKAINKYALDVTKAKPPKVVLKEIPKRKSKVIVQGQSSKIKLKVSKKQKLVLKKKKKQPISHKLSKKKSANKYKITRGNWRPGARNLKKVYQRALSSRKIPSPALRAAFKYYEKNKRRKRLSPKYIVVADYTTNSRSRRLHVISLSTGKVKSYQVAHGRRSGPVGGKVHSTSNRRGSNKTSKGFFKVGFKEGRTIKKGYRYLSVTGLERGNRKVGLPTRMGGRDVVIHTASYVASGGRSNGCFAIKPSDRRAIFSRIKGSLLYSYAGKV